MYDIKDRICVIPGMPRTGTTFLHFYLQKHPGLFVPYRKETDFFVFNHKKGIEWYINLFKEQKEDQTGLDASPLYFLDTETAGRIADMNPDCKVIMGVRNPIDWSISVYKHFITNNNENIDFQDFCDSYDYYSHQNILHFELKNDYVIKRIEEYKEKFGKNLLLYSYDYLKEKPLELLNRIEDFLGLERYFSEENFENKILNSGDRSKLFVFLLSYRWIRNSLAFIERILPRSISIFLNRMYLLMATKPKSTKEKKTEKDPKREFSEKFFSKEIEYIKNLFKTSGLILGNNEPYIKNSTHE